MANPSGRGKLEERVRELEARVLELEGEVAARDRTNDDLLKWARGLEARAAVTLVLRSWAREESTAASAARASRNFVSACSRSRV